MPEPDHPCPCGSGVKHSRCCMGRDRTGAREHGAPGRPSSLARVSPPAIDDSDCTLAEIVARLVTAYQPDRIYLFGSHARGEAGPDSDYDLLVVVPDAASPEKRRSRLAYEVLWGIPDAADVLVRSRTEFDSRLHLRASLPSIVLDEGRLLYAA